MVRLLICTSVLLILSCKAAKPELVNIGGEKLSPKPAFVVKDLGVGRMAVGAVSNDIETTSYKLRGRAAIIPQNSYQESTNYLMRGQVEL